MGEKERDTKGKKSEGKKPLKRAMTMASVVASLGVSLGVNVGDLLALDLSATDPCGDLTQISMGQNDLTSQAKRLSDQQRNLITQVQPLLGTTIPLSQFTVLQSNMYNLLDQIKRSHLTEGNLRYRISTDNAGITTRINYLQSRENDLANLIRTLEASQLKLINLLGNIRVDQNK